MGFWFLELPLHLSCVHWKQNLHLCTTAEAWSRRDDEGQRKGSGLCDGCCCHLATLPFGCSVVSQVSSSWSRLIVKAGHEASEHHPEVWKFVCRAHLCCFSLIFYVKHTPELRSLRSSASSTSYVTLRSMQGFLSGFNQCVLAGGRNSAAK